METVYVFMHSMRRMRDFSDVLDSDPIFAIGWVVLDCEVGFTTAHYWRPMASHTTFTCNLVRMMSLHPMMTRSRSVKSENILDSSNPSTTSYTIMHIS